MAANARFFIRRPGNARGRSSPSVVAGVCSWPVGPIASFPVVTVSAVNGSETGPLAGSFVFTRTGNTVNSLTVTFAVGGTATSGVDYLAIGNSVLIPAGQSSVSVPVTVTEDDLIEADETVVVSLVSNVAYALGTPNSATLTIADNDVYDCGSNATAVSDLVWTVEPPNAAGSTTMAGGDGTFSFDSAIAGSTGGLDASAVLCNPRLAYDIEITITASGSGDNPIPISFAPMSFTLFLNDVPISSGTIGPATLDAGAWSASGATVLTVTLPSAAVSTLYLDIGLLVLDSEMSGTIQVRPLTPP